MRRILLIVGLLVVPGLASCGTGAGSGGGDTRTVLIDYKHDEFASAFLDYFPRNVKVHPGDTVRFRQTWTGEAHTVTMGTAVDEFVPFAIDAIRKYPGGSGAPPELFQKFEELDAKIPDFFYTDEATGEDGISQAGTQPCYAMNASDIPTDQSKPCPDELQEQPEFTGKHVLYNSGFIPYEGSRGNTFDVSLADDIEPGSYSYYCNLHFVEMSGTVEVVPESEDIPSQADVSRQAKAEIDEVAEILVKANDAAANGRAHVKGNLAGYLDDEGGGELQKVGTFAMVNEFFPNRIEAKAGTPITWTVSGSGHTVSFNVPTYFPIYTVKDDGTVEPNDQAFDPVEWTAPQRPEPPPGEEEEFGSNPVKFDAGRWDGSGGLHSSGVLDPESTFTLTITKPGTYKYACLIHPPMVAEVVVT